MKKIFFILLLAPVIVFSQTSKQINDYPFWVGNPSNPHNVDGFNFLIQPNGGGTYRKMDGGQLLASKVDTVLISRGSLYDTVWTVKSGVKSFGGTIRVSTIPQLKTVGGQSILGTGDIPISGSSGGFDTSIAATYNAVKKIAQDNAVPVDYYFDTNSFDTASSRLYVKGMRFFPSVATSYGTVNLDPYSSNAGGKITFTSNGTAIPSDGIIATVTFVTSTYSFAPFVSVNTLESASAGQNIYPSTVSVNSFQLRIKTGFTPTNGAVYYYTYRVTPSSNVSGQ